MVPKDLKDISELPSDPFLQTDPESLESESKKRGKSDTPDSFKALMEGGLENADPEKLVRVRKVLEKMLAANLEEPRLYFYLGMVLKEQEEWERVSGCLKKALELDSQNSEYRDWYKKVEKESRSLSLKRYSSSLGQVYSQIGEKVVLLSGESGNGRIHEEALQEDIELAREFQKKIAFLVSSPQTEGALAESVQEEEVSSPVPPISSPAPVADLPASLEEPPVSPAEPPVFLTTVPEQETRSKSPQDLREIKKELKNLYQFISGKTESAQQKISDKASEEKSIVPDGVENVVSTNKHIYHKELENLETFERLDLFQLIDALDSPDPKMRKLAVTSLEEKGLNLINPILLKKWLEETVPEIQLKIVSVLVRRNYAPLVLKARQVLENDRVNWALSAMEALYRLDSQRNLSYLRKALKSKLSIIKKRAVTYIGWIKDHSSIPDLIQLLRDPDPFVRKSAVSALASMRVKRPVHFIIETLMDPNPEVRSFSFRTLKKLINDTFDYDPQADFISRQTMVKRLSVWWEDVEKEYSLDKDSVNPPAATFSPKQNSDSDTKMEDITDGSK